MKRILARIVLVTIGLSSGLPLAAQETRFSGRLQRFTAVTRDLDPKFAPQGEWRNIPGMWVEFSTTVDGAAVATYCGGHASSQTSYLALRMRGSGTWHPPAVELEPGTFTHTHACVAFFATLPAGDHRVRIQWNANDPEYTQVIRRSLKIEHEK